MAQDKIDIYQKVADQLVEMMETMGTGWTKPWRDINQPINLISGKAYRGLNVLFLMTSEHENQTWATYKQWLSKSYQVQKGETGTTITFYKPFKITDKVSGKDKTIPLLRTYTVFNGDQVRDKDGNPYVTPTIAPLSESERNSVADDFIRNTGANIQDFKSKACYIPARDEIHMPDYAAFTDSAAYYGTVFHELGHWTGAKSRLNRLDSGTYAWEELVAELSASMTCAALGIESTPREDHAQYLNGWIAQIKNDPRALSRAITKAKQASEYLEKLQETAEEKLAA
jgi:antirestriction protein ArdC